MKTIYHGSLERITEFSDDGLYFTESIEEACNYIDHQNFIFDGGFQAGESYGYIYAVEVDEGKLIMIEDIDDAKKFKGVVFCEEDNYYRIDKPSQFKIRELSETEIQKLF